MEYGQGWYDAILAAVKATLEQMGQVDVDRALRDLREWNECTRVKH